MTERDIEAGEVRLDEGVGMSLVGVDLALRHADVVPLEELGVEIEVATLPVLVVLKIVAWLDRPYERDKDLEDLAAILDRALPDDDERRWEPEHPVFLSGLDHEDQSAFFIGSEVARIVDERHRCAIATFRAARRSRRRRARADAPRRALRRGRWGSAPREEAGRVLERNGVAAIGELRLCRVERKIH